MPAATTLSTTTLVYYIDSNAHEVKLTSGTGITPGLYLWIDRELLKVMSLPDSNNIVSVKRGIEGTAPSRHMSSALVTIGRPDQFYSHDPYGSPPPVVLVSPYINILNGKVWLAQGDPNPDFATARWWQEVTNTYPFGSLGINQNPSPTPTVST